MFHIKVVWSKETQIGKINFLRSYKRHFFLMELYIFLYLMELYIFLYTM